MCLDMSKQDCKVFIGGLSWETTGEKLRAYFENYGAVREAFVSYNRNNGRPRGFGFVVFESPEIADKVVSAKHTIDRREVEAKKAVPKEETATPAEANGGVEAAGSQKTRKIFVGGLAPGVDDAVLRQYFEQFGEVEDAVVMYDHDNKRPRGFGFVSFAQEESVDKVFGMGAMQYILDKQIEIKPAVPRDQMPAAPRGLPPAYYHPGQQMMLQQRSVLGPYGTPARPYGYGPHMPLGAPSFPPPVQNNTFRPPYGPHSSYMQPQNMQPQSLHAPPSNPRPTSQPRQPQFGGSLGSPPTVSMPTSLSASLHQAPPQPDVQQSGVSNPNSFSGSGTGTNTLQSAQQQAAAVAAATANGYSDLYALSNGNNSIFSTSAQAAALYNIANGAFPQHLNGMQTGAADVSSKLSSLGQQGLNSLKALAAGYSPYGDSQHTGGGYTDDPTPFTTSDTDVFAEQVNTRMAGLTVSGGEYGSPFNTTSTIGSGWSH